MRILLAHNSLYFPSHGGGDKSNRLLMEALAARGHEVRAVARVERFGESGHENYLHELARRGIEAEALDSGAVQMTMGGVDVRTLTRDSRWRQFFSAQVEEFKPEIIVTSTDDPAQLLFELAIKSEARVVYLVRATIAVPFGPESSSVSADRTARLRQADATVGVSQYVADYCRREGSLDAIHVPISLMDTSTPESLGSFDNPYVTMANPCLVKGIDIFLALADRLPEVKFAAVPMWGTTTRDRAELLRRPNITMFDPFDRIDDLLRLTRVMLVPSVWHEARSRMIVESMARGVPVMASDVGGIREAMMGVDYLLPVNPVEQYQPTVDEHMVPMAVVPPQDVEPWAGPLKTLWQNRAVWQQLSEQSRAAALDYLEHLTVVPFEAILEDLRKRPKKVAMAAASPAEDKKKQLLALLVKKRAAANAWLPVNGPAPRLVCFPAAGAGTMGFRKWKLPLTVAPLLLPGRETRLAEAALETMPQLVNAIVEVLDGWLSEPLAVFGHSMGAVVAFEVIRELRRRGRKLPRALVVAGARAPQYRRGWTPPKEPTDAEFLAELRRLEGIPAKVLASPSLLALVLPALRADTRLYRNYVYSEGEPLPVPVVAYGGETDPNVTAQHVADWAAQTTGAFVTRMFPGGHFFVDTAQEAVLGRIEEDLTAVGAFPLNSA